MDCFNIFAFSWIKLEICGFLVPHKFQNRIGHLFINIFLVEKLYCIFQKHRRNEISDLFSSFRKASRILSYSDQEFLTVLRKDSCPSFANATTFCFFVILAFINSIYFNWNAKLKEFEYHLHSPKTGII